MIASVTAGTALAAVGVVTARLARRAAERPLALVPLLFGAQQLTEGVVWWAVDHDDAGANLVATAAYTFFARVLWPVFVPVVVLCLETVAWRRRAVAALLVLGSVVALDGVSVVVRGPHTAHVVGSSLQYAVPSTLVVVSYLVATCGSCVVSSHRFLRLLGVGALGLGLLTLWLDLAVFVSVWCFFSAVLTVLVLGHFLLQRSSRRPRQLRTAR